MTPIESLLQPFAGYLELGMYEDALAELDGLPQELQTHPAASLARLELFMETGEWAEGAIWGEFLRGQWPEEHEFHFKAAYCLHELKRTQEAKDILLSAPATIRDTALFYYNLACYETQLGHVEAAKQLLKTCFKKEKAFREEAGDDPDLEPIRDSLEDL